MGTKNFKVVIVGGSIAGLTLANMLEKFGIDFVVLEAYPEIAPQVGASIALFPNGLRILDQLGCYPAIRALIDEPIHTLYIHDPDGNQLLKTADNFPRVTKRHGYPVIFVDRRMVMEVLYNNIKDKSKVKVNKAAVEVNLLDSGVEVKTKDGDCFTGDIVVGADGIHSTIRKEMWRIANTIEPGYIPQSEYTAMPCDYKVIFGISVIKDFEPCTVNVGLGDGHSYLLATGPSHRVYWFIHVKLDKTYYGDDIPRYTKADEEKLVKTHWDAKVAEGFTFGDLYSSRISSVLTPVPEYVFKKWYFKRIITIGDAVHKFEPLSGQGGNNAIESGASLINHIIRAMDKNPGGLSGIDIENVFADTQAYRTDRAWELVKASHAQQTVEAMDTPLLGFIAKYVVPKTTAERQIAQWASAVFDATRIEGLEVPKNFHFIPFRDELPAKPLGRAWLSSAVIATVFLFLFYTAQQWLEISFEDLNYSFAGGPLRSSYTGIGVIDSVLEILVLAVSEVAGDNKEMALQHLYFLAMLMPTIFNWTVEGYRTGNSFSPTTWPIIFGIAYQLLGIGKIAPLYFLISVYTTTNPILSRTSGRPIPASVAKALTPAVFIGFVIPTCLMFIPFEDLSLRQSIIAIWQPFPISVAILTSVIAAAIQTLEGRRWSVSDGYQQKDLAPLQAGYALTFFMTAIVHICSISYIWATPSLSATRIFWNIAASSGSADPRTVLNWFWQNDMILYFASITAWTLYSVYDMRRLGYATTRQAISAALTAIAGQLLVGPGATYAGVWYWRETVIASQVKIGE